MTPHKEAPASKDGWAEKIATTCIIYDDEEGFYVQASIEKVAAALLEAEERGSLGRFQAMAEAAYAEKLADEALLREIGTAFATCLRYADPRAFNISTGKHFKEEWDEIVRKVEARLTPKVTGEKEK